MAEAGVGEKSARRTLARYSAVLIVVVVVVHLGFVAKGGEGDFPVWALSVSWTAAAATVLMGIFASALSDRVLTLFAWIAVLGYWGTLVVFPFAVPAEGIDRIPWNLSASGAAAAAALVAGGRPTAWVTVVAGSTAGLVYRAVFGGLDLDGVANDLQSLLTGSVICVIGGHILSVGRGLDVAAASMAEAAAQESAEKGRFAARSQAAALVHDEVLATLAIAAADHPMPPGPLTVQARKAASMVATLAEEQEHEQTGLRSALARAAREHSAVFSVRDDSPALPSTVTAEAVLGATRQALRNSVQHAPDSARRVVLVRSGTEILVEIIDDGPGFDPALIADDRLGIRQSIVGRMARIEGGSAEIQSAPGRGTAIRLRVVMVPARQWGDTGDAVALRTGLVVIGVLYVLTQSISGLLAAIAVPGSWPLQLAMLASALTAAQILRSSPGRIPSPRRALFAVAMACGAFAAGAIAAHDVFDMPFVYGSMWFAVAFAFVFVELALRRRVVFALAGAGIMVLTVILVGAIESVPLAQIVQVSARPIVVVVFASALIVVAEHMQGRIAILHRDAVAATERESWTAAARAELTERVSDLAVTVIPLLEKIGTGHRPSVADRREYAKCEAQLRDTLRAGALVGEPLTSAVAAARERGVEVLLLDDSGGGMGGPAVESILVWMAELMATADRRAVGRLLPHGRDSLASLTVDGGLAEFGANNVGRAGDGLPTSSPTLTGRPISRQSSVSSFQGE